ncbi:MAG: MMPL family transporter [Pseudomonadota bacterium]
MNTLTFWLIRLRIPIILLCLALTGAASVGLGKLTFKSDYRSFFSETNPQLIAFDKLQKTFSKNENLLIVVAPATGKVFSASTLAAVETLTEKAWKLPFTTRVDSITNFQYSHAQSDHLVVVDLVENGLEKSPSELALLEKIALTEPLLVNRLISPDARVTGINVTFRLPDPPEGDEIPTVVDAVRKAVSDVQAEFTGLNIQLTGSVMMDNAFAEASEHDGKTLIPVMITLVVAALWILLRSFTGMLVSVAVIVMAMVTALGLAGWLNIPLSPTAAAAPNILLTVAVADCVHLLNGFYKSIRHGAERRQAIAESLEKNLKAVFLTSVTTAIGFLSMNASDAPPFHDLGNITAMGVAAAFVYSMLFIPACMTVLPKHKHKRTANRFSWERRFSGFLRGHTNAVLISSVLFTLVLIAFIQKIELNDEFVEYFDQTIEFRRATDFTNDHLTGIYYMDYAVDSGESSGIARPEYMRTLEAFAQWYRAQPETLHVFSVTDIVKKLNQNLHGDDPDFYKIPGRRDLIAQYLLIYQMSLPFGLDLNDRIDVDQASTRMTATLRSISSREVIGLENRAREWLENHGFNTATSYASGTTLMFAHIGQRNIETMLKGTLAALVLISLILIFALRSFKAGLISLIPNLVPAAMAFGLWGALIGQVGLAVSVVAAMTLGIVVDDTVHFLSHYQHARRTLGMHAGAAVEHALTTVGSALLITSIALSLGFFVLAFSSFEINASMGLLTAVAILFALMADFFLLPTLLIKFEESKHERKVSDRLAAEPGLH